MNLTIVEIVATDAGWNIVIPSLVIIRLTCAAAVGFVAWFAIKFLYNLFWGN